MSVHHSRHYWLTCDECGTTSEHYPYGPSESSEFKGRGVRYARTMASRDGWSAFSERDRCPEHSHKRATEGDAR